MQGNPFILICDDQAMVHETLGVYLDAEGFTHASAYDGEKALEMAQGTHPDLIILDIMMPKMTGIDVCREVRKVSRVPIIMLTAKGEEIDRVLGLELGADDYIVKPFSPREVVARIKAVLRRVTETTPDTPQILRFDDLEIDMNAYEIRLSGESVNATPKEVEVLYMLASRPGQLFNREQILTRVWGDTFVEDRAVDTQIKRIRQKLPKEASYSIESIYGKGYKFMVKQG